MAEIGQGPERISIHAPRDGSDLTVANRLTDRQNFYPRSPRGERQREQHSVYIAKGFLSTLPARGATIEPYKFDVLIYISIHAPREGSDLRRI